VLENYTFLTPGVETEKANLYGFHESSSGQGFLTAAVNVTIQKRSWRTTMAMSAKPTLAKNSFRLPSLGDNPETRRSSFAEGTSLPRVNKK
jgi:hypothetical protein